MVNRTLPDFEWPQCFSSEPQQLTTHGQTEAQRRKVLKDGYHRAQYRLTQVPTRPAPGKNL